MILYRSDTDDKNVSEELLKTANHTSTSYLSIELINNEMQIQIIWEGLPDSRDGTWESLPQMLEDVPDLLRDFLKWSSSILKTKSSFII